MSMGVNTGGGGVGGDMPPPPPHPRVVPPKKIFKKIALSIVKNICIYT